MITPAKWQTAEANQRIDSQMSYGDFRKKIVPHMKEVVYYPDCADVFRIKILDGIQYYFIDKLNTYESCRVINSCRNQKLFNNEQYRPILDGQVLNNCGNDVIEHLKNNGYKQLRCQAIAKDRQFVVYQNNVLQCARSIPNEYQAYGMLQYKEGKNLVLGATDIIDTGKEMYELELSGVQTAIFSQDNRKECESFVQYINTKLCKFLIFVNISKMQPYNDNTFRFVPSPMILDNSGNRICGEFDHIYTDDELYKTWNIPQKYIEVIEAVVKERDPEIYEMAYNEKAFKIFRRAKEVELNIRVKMQKILRENDINIQEYGYDLQMLKNSEDIKKCEDLVDDQISLVDQFFQLSSLEYSVPDLVNCFCRYPKMIQTWMKNKDIYKNGKFISIDSVLHEILVGYADFLDRNKWELIKNKLKTYGIYSKQQIEMIIFMYNLVEILTSLQFNQDNLKALQEQGVRSGDNQLGESEYSAVYKLS